jgi:putative glycosyltransferase (TIGR04372 family)
LRYRYRIALSAIWAMPATLIMRMVRPLVLIRVCGIRSYRIGHFVADVSEHIGREKIKPPRTFNFYFLQGPISNTQWELMAKRSSLRISGKWLSFLDDWNNFIPGGKLHTINSSLTDSRDVEGLFQQFDCSIPFLPLEDASCEGWLKSKGWKKGEPFVALLVRDSEYLNQTRPNLDWSYHNYRDSNIQTFVPALEWLASQGVWVLRMGKFMSTPLETKSNRVVDYAFDVEKSDLLDIWLFANSSAIISTASGLDQLGGIYRKPILFLNAMPLFDMASSYNMTWIPKRLRWRSTDQDLTLSEVLENSFYHTGQYIEKGIDIVNLSEEEILSYVIEFWQQESLGRVPKSNEVELNESFWQILEASPAFHVNHGWRHPKAKVSSSWLISMGVEFLR